MGRCEWALELIWLTDHILAPLYLNTPLSSIIWTGGPFYRVLPTFCVWLLETLLCTLTLLLTITCWMLTLFSALSSSVSCHNPIVPDLKESYEEIKDDGELETWVLVLPSRLHLKKKKKLAPSDWFAHHFCLYQELIYSISKRMY